MLADKVAAKLKAAPDATTRMMAHGRERLKEEVLNGDVPKIYDNQLGGDGGAPGDDMNASRSGGDWDTGGQGGDWGVGRLRSEGIGDRPGY